LDRGRACCAGDDARARDDRVCGPRRPALHARLRPRCRDRGCPVRREPADHGFAPAHERVFEDPDEFRADRVNAEHHLTSATARTYARSRRTLASASAHSSTASRVERFASPASSSRTCPRFERTKRFRRAHELATARLLPPVSESADISGRPPRSAAIVPSDEGALLARWPWPWRPKWTSRLRR
jgi:hypothetical protein